MKTPAILVSHWRLVMGVLAVVIVYLILTRKTVKVIGTVDASGQGMTVNGVQ